MLRKYPNQERSGFQVYENVSEGTSVSPAFRTAREVVDWLVGEGVSRCGAENFRKAKARR